MVINAIDSTLNLYGELIKNMKGQDELRVLNGSLEFGGKRRTNTLFNRNPILLWVTVGTIPWIRVFGFCDQRPYRRQAIYSFIFKK
jgi:hypothetical protein